jgi:hypothetical protein
MSTVDNDLKNFLVNDAGISKETVDDGFMIAGWAAAAYSGYGYLIAAYQFLDNFFGSSDNSSTKQVEAKLNAILANQDADKISEVVNDLKLRAAKIDNAWMATRAYGHSPSAETRATVLSNLTDDDGLTVSLLSLLEGKSYRFMPEVYGSPSWAYGQFRWANFYHYYPTYSFSGNTYSSSLSSTMFQLYEQPNVPLDSESGLPEPLRQGHNRWDALLCLPLLFNGIPVWQTTLAALEPFYRLSGVWVDRIDGMLAKMLAFEATWLQKVLWIREMPSASELAAEGLHLKPIPEQLYPGVPIGNQSTAFFNWPCGVVDPLMGIEIMNQTWWKAGNDSELWTDDQAAEFKKQRLIQHMNLQKKNGFEAFGKLMGATGKLRLPPLISPSLKIHPKSLKVEHPSPAGPPAMAFPQYTEVTDPSGITWNAHVMKTSVIVTEPISVQPNPAPAGHARRANSDTVFGYQIKLTPTGAKEKVGDWVWQLRTSDAQSSLYHKENGELRPVPYTIKQKLTASATTWETITDGQYRERRDEQTGTVAFTVTITVADQEPPRISEDEFVLAGAKWNLHGAVWVRIEADKEENLGRSFELKLEVRETAAVDAKGYPAGHQKFSGKFKTYHLETLLPVDICRVFVPTNYFGWLARLLGDLRTATHGFGIPVPDPDPDPALELTLWHSVLEKNPALLQRHVHDLRRLNGHTTITPEQALAQLNEAAIKVTMQPQTIDGVVMEEELDTALTR